MIILLLKNSGIIVVSTIQQILSICDILGTLQGLETKYDLILKIGKNF